MIRTRLFCAALLCLAAAAPAWGDDDCRLARVTSVPMTTDESGGVVVPMTVSGQAVTLLVDTGSIDSMLTQSTVNALALPASLMRGHATMIGGTRIDHFVTGRDIVFGGLKAPRMDFFIMPDGRMPPEVNGTLGPDIMRAYDDDFDFANARFSLFSPDHCEGKVVWWTHDDPAQIPFELDRFGKIKLAVQLDGKTARVNLDTGSSRSNMSLELAESLFGFDEKSPDLKLLEGRDGRRAYKYPFKMLTFGGVTIANPDILLIPDDQARLPHDGFRIGMGVLRQLHLYIAYREQKLYVTPASAH